MEPEQTQIYETLLELLHSIKKGDVESYKKYTHEELSCFEPETQGHPVNGLPFHLFLLEHTEPRYPYHIEIVNPTIRVFDHTAYATYTLLTTYWKDDQPEIFQVNETRIFHLFDNQWKMVHFHRS